MWLVLGVLLVAFFGSLLLMALRWRKIKHYGIGGGELSPPFADIGDGGFVPGTVIQEDFGGTTTVQSTSASSSDPLDG
ncbi:hypothetical protein [Nocardia sp. CC227C]|uniref:hypothetical protein n=1 Tax=Nocardia sp. CC227C TaxID=3044562 RepID=UPI00278C656B|nr:hypothetical protein [Nocardia sp. CC227C]